MFHNHGRVLDVGDAFLGDTTVSLHGSGVHAHLDWSIGRTRSIEQGRTAGVWLSCDDDEDEEETRLHNESTFESFDS